MFNFAIAILKNTILCIIQKFQAWDIMFRKMW
jgi:hypothetical protein